MIPPLHSLVKNLDGMVGMILFSLTLFLSPSDDTKGKIESTSS